MHALTALRAELEPDVPVIGTVPAVKPAARGGGPVAIWATPATTGSPYQARLIEEFGQGAQITEVPCHGLADAVESADEHAVDVAVAAAAALTPRGVRAVVLGCTHYELVGERIRTAVSTTGSPLPVLFRSADAVAAQALRRIGAEPDPHAAHTGGLTVLLSGRSARLPEAAGHVRRGAAAHRGHSVLLNALRSPLFTRARATGSAPVPPPAHGRTLRCMSEHFSLVVPLGEVWTGRATNRVQWLLASLGAGCLALGIALGVETAWELDSAPLIMSVVGCLAAGLLGALRHARFRPRTGERRR